MRPSHRQTVAALTSGLLALVLAGCSATPGLSVGGSTGSGTRWVTRGDELVVRMDAAENGAQTWRITSFDSLMLRLTQTARPTTERNGRTVWIARFVARTPGTCEIEFTRIARGPKGQGELGERRLIRVRINER